MKKTKKQNTKHTKHTIIRKKKQPSKQTPMQIPMQTQIMIKPRLTKKLSDKIKELSSGIKTKMHDKLFQDARKYIDEDKNFKEGTDIYLYLINNDYNKENITKWLLFNSTDYNIRKYAFNNLLRQGKVSDEDKLKMFIDMISNKSKYDFDMRQYDNVLQTVNKMMDNENLCNKLDLFNIIYYSDFSSQPNWFNRIKYYCNAFQSYDKTYQPTLGNITEDKLTNLGIYTLYDQSPAFKVGIEVISFLSEMVPITLYVEGTTIDSKYDKYVKDKANLKIELIGGKTDEELINMMKNNNHIFLIFIYGFHKRRNVVLAHPAKYTFHYLDLYNIYTKRLYDFNIIDKYSYNYLKNLNPDVENDFGLVKLDVPVHMHPVCNECSIQRPEYNSDKINIGLIVNECKLCNNTINIINKILSKNKNIFLTIYTYCDKTWLFSNFNKKYHSRIDVKSYDNNNYMNELNNNLLYIDTILCSSHSTAMEILKCNRPFVAFKNKTKYFGLVSSNIIQHIDMCNELCADTVDKYIELVLKHLQTKDAYYKLYDKFVANMEKSKILDNKNYAKELYDKLSELYKTLSLSFLNNLSNKQPLLQSQDNLGILCPIITGGLGNQLFQIGAAITMARKYNRKLVISKHHFAPNHHQTPEKTMQTLNNLFNKLPLCIIDKHIPDSYNFGTDGNEVIAYIDLTTRIPKDIIQGNKNLLISGYFQNPRHLPYDYYNLITITPTRSITEIINDYGDLQNTYFIHIRLGDYLNPEWAFLRLNLETYFIDCIKKIKSFNPTATFIICTNEHSENLERYLEHIRKITQFKIQSNKDDEIDTLYIMTQCRGGICSNSTFSWSGCYFQKSRINETSILDARKHIYMPYPWFINTNYTEDYLKGIYPDWATIYNTLTNDFYATIN